MKIIQSGFDCLNNNIKLYKYILYNAFVSPGCMEFQFFHYFLDYWNTSRRIMPTRRNRRVSRAFTQTIMWSFINLNCCCINQIRVWLHHLSSTRSITMACVENAIKWTEVTKPFILPGECPVCGDINVIAIFLSAVLV